jgi:hypothetical protein
MGVNENKPVLALVRSFHRADGNTYGAFAVVAQQGQKYFSDIRVASLFHLFHPGTPHPQGNGILPFAGYRAGVAPDAFS